MCNKNVTVSYPKSHETTFWHSNIKRKIMAIGSGNACTVLIFYELNKSYSVVVFMSMRK